MLAKENLDKYIAKDNNPENAKAILVKKGIYLI